MVPGSPEETPFLKMETLTPKVFIISMFKNEAEIWQSAPDRLDVKVNLIHIPGLWKEYPKIYCSKDADVCQVVTGEGLINAALTISALVASPLLDLSKTYFLIAGVAGINPKMGTVGSVVLSRYAVQVDLQYEFDSREIPTGWKTGYVPQGANNPTEAPKFIYGTEVYELNSKLRKLAKGFAERATLSDSEAAQAFRSRYSGPSSNVFEAATKSPSISEGDVLSANTFFHGHLLCEAFEETCRSFTNGKGSYYVTAQEDNGTLAALHRGAVSKKLDFSRIIILRTGCNFDRPPPAEFSEMPLHSSHGGFEIAIENLYSSGIEIVEGILLGWQETFEAGIVPDNYVGDVLGQSGGRPDKLSEN
ncbi:purine nucleoside permease [Mollisia scopiformis]|uniref:Purine nucleoside permease n=1 Tax=Mollisia scopiformis TaxID=149040 RepID=A0A194WYV6_MOLSC|nr:purine nucleoside permease [Mollisia scopiformis]KUJ13148.1 purine nucleoside permease [Mollisia scopiformis]